MADGPLVQISIRGANVVIINGTVFAALVPPPNAATWIASVANNGTLRFTDQASGLVLAAPDTQPGTQAIAAPASVGAPVSSWTVTQFSDDEGDDAVQITDPSKLTSGYYTLQDPATQAYLYRNRIEDRSLLPKRVALQPAGDLYELVIQVVG